MKTANKTSIITGIPNLSSPLGKLYNVLEDFEKLGTKFEGIGINFEGMGISANDLFHGAKSSKRTKPNPSSVSVKVRNLNDVAYWIEYKENPSPAVLLNGVRVLATPHFDYENDQIFRYLMSVPGKKVTVEDIEKNVLRCEMKKSLHEIVRSLGFSGDLLKIFITKSKDAITFRNNITYKDLKEMKISYDPQLLTGNTPA